MENNKNTLHLFHAFQMAHAFIDLRQKTKKWVLDDISRGEIEFLQEIGDNDNYAWEFQRFC